MYVQTESAIQKQLESVILEQARVTKREAHTTGSRTRLLRVGGSCPERADPAQTSEGADLREVGVLVSGSPEKVRFCLRKTGIPGL